MKTGVQNTPTSGSLHLMNKPPLSATIIDHSTGEILAEGMPMIVPRPKPKPFNEDFMLIAQSAAAAIAKQGLSKPALTAWLYLLSQCEYEGWVMDNPETLARRGAFDPSNFRKALRELLDAGAVLKQADERGTIRLRLNPEHVWKGRETNRRKAATKLRLAAINADPSKGA